MKMNIILIISGVVLIIAGIVMTSTDNRKTKETDYTPLQENTENEHHSPHVKLDPKTKGNDFEDFFADLLKLNGLTLKEWNKGTVTKKGTISENTLNPDFLIEDKTATINLKYWIECKYRSTVPGKGFSIDEYQVERYRDIQKQSKRKILIALGTGGEPFIPSDLFLIPLDSIVRFKHIPSKYLENYRIDKSDDSMRDHIRKYFFEDVFKK